ncbi:MAG: FliH/SctL family protein [Neptuniibacter sp.]
MSQDSKPYKRLRAEDVQEFQGWSLPQVGRPAGVGLQQKDPVQVQVVEEEIAAEKITVAELESIRETARLEGLSAGLEEGRLEGKAEGHENGVQEGKEQGYKEGFAQGEAEVKRLQSLLQQMVQELKSPVEQVAEDVEQLLLNMVLQLSEKVVGAELAERKGQLVEVIRSALSQLPETTGQVKIFVNSSDHQYVEDVVSTEDPNVEVMQDASVAAGGFKMEAANTIVKHEVEERFAYVADQFAATLASPETDDEQGA